MRSTYKKTYVIGVVLVAVISIFQQNIIAAVTDRTVSITGAATKLVTPGPLLDDFRYGAPINVWGTQTSTFGSTSPNPIGNCTASYVATSGTGSNGNCLKLDYNVSALNSFSGYSSNLGSVSLASPVSYTAVSFWIKGAAGGEFFKIQLKKASSAASVYITDYLDGGVTNAWKKVTIPFHNFVNLGNLANWGSMAEFVIVFENAQSVTNGSSTQGIVYIDDITFETTAVTTVRVDHFGDKLGTCALGGNIGTTDGSSGSTISYDFRNGNGEYDLYAYGLGITYNVNASDSWAAAYAIFGGGNTGWTAVPHDFNAYNTLSISVRGGTGNPKTMKIELVDSGGAKSYVIAGITTNWQTFKMPLSSFPLFKKDSIKQMTFVLEGWRIEQATGNKVGTVFIDSVQFE